LALTKVKQIMLAAGAVENTRRPQKKATANLPLLLATERDHVDQQEIRRITWTSPISPKFLISGSET
jgi:hypothetical protein